MKNLNSAVSKGAIVCFGEMLLRLSPESSGSLIDASAYQVHVAGAEANVAISLACLGQKSRMITILPDSPLGQRAISELDRYGVDTSAIVRTSGRMGLFFINSQTSGREGGLIYDRAGSAFANVADDALDWPYILDRASWLHISGITAALGEKALFALEQAIRSAIDAGVKISFDCNFRPALWKGREEQAKDIFDGIVRFSDLLFAGVWDLTHITGVEAAAATESEKFTILARRTFHHYPKLTAIAATSRSIVLEGHHRLGAHFAKRDCIVHISETDIYPVVDRIGAGDAFAADILFGIQQDWDDDTVLVFAHRATIMKHGIAGDFSTLSSASIAASI